MASKVTKMGSMPVTRSKNSLAITRGAMGIPKLLQKAEKMPKTKKHLGVNQMGKIKAKNPM